VSRIHAATAKLSSVAPGDMGVAHCRLWKFVLIADQGIDNQDFVLGPPYTLASISVAMITNADTGVLVSWQQGAYYLEARPGQPMPVTVRSGPLG
jgi:hypothetical protein